MKNHFSKKRNRWRVSLMKKHIGFSLFILLFAILIGHFQHDELHNVAFISAIGIDHSKKGYNVSVQVLNPLAFSPQGQSSLPFFVFEQEGHSINHIMSKLTQRISRKIEVSHIQTIIISEQIAKKMGLKKGLHNMIRASNFPYDTTVLIARNYKAKDFLEVLPFFETVTSREIASHLKNISQERGSVFPTFLTKLQGDILKDGKDAAIPTIHFKGNINEAKNKSAQQLTNANLKEISFDGLQLFKRNYSTGWINSNLSPYYYLLNNKLQHTNIRANCHSNKEISLNVLKSHTKIRGQIHNDTPTFTISIKVTGNISDYSCKYDLSSVENGQKIQKIVEEEIKKKVTKLLEITKKKNSDIIGFGEILEIYDNKNWKEVKKDWVQMYPKSEFTIEVDVTIQNYGDII